jgi:hypothetical protein
MYADRNETIQGVQTEILGVIEGRLLNVEKRSTCRPRSQRSSGPLLTGSPRLVRRPDGRDPD